MYTMYLDHSKLLAPTPPRTPNIVPSHGSLHIFSSFIIITFPNSSRLISVACQEVAWCFWLDLTQVVHGYPQF